MGTDTITKAAEIAEQRAAERVELVKAVVKASETATRTRQLLVTAKEVREAGPDDVADVLDDVVEAATRAASVATESAAKAWKKATAAGGWSAADLRRVGLTPIRSARRAPGENPAAPAAGPATDTAEADTSVTGDGQQPTG